MALQVGPYDEAVLKSDTETQLTSEFQKPSKSGGSNSSINRTTMPHVSPATSNYRASDSGVWDGPWLPDAGSTTCFAK